MSGRIVTLELPPHQAVQELLPWFLSGRLGEAETAKVQQHLQSCLQCQQELESQRLLRAASPPIVDGLNVDSALAKLLPRLDQSDATPAPPAAARLPWWRKTAANAPVWLPWALAAQFLVIAGLSLLLTQPAPARYQLLGTAGPANANLVVVFQSGIAEGELRRILRAHHARLVDGPTVTDAYLLAVPNEQRDAIVQGLRAEPGIKLAEPLGGAAGDRRP
jgi:hypothetical protein